MFEEEYGGNGSQRAGLGLEESPKSESWNETRAQKAGLGPGITHPIDIPIQPVRLLLRPDWTRCREKPENGSWIEARAKINWPGFGTPCRSSLGIITVRRRNTTWNKVIRVFKPDRVFHWRDSRLRLPIQEAILR